MSGGSLSLPPEKPSEAEQLARDVIGGVVWFLAHPRFLALVAVTLSGLCYSHRLPSFSSILTPAAAVAQEHP